MGFFKENLGPASPLDAKMLEIMSQQTIDGFEIEEDWEEAEFYLETEPLNTPEDNADGGTDSNRDIS